MIFQLPYYLYSTVSKIMGWEYQSDIDPRIGEILSKLNQSISFRQLVEEQSAANIKVVYRLLSDEECNKLNIYSAALNPNRSLFSSENEILIKESLPEIKKCKSIIMERCNISFIKEYLDLDQRAKSLDREKYALSKEEIEWEAFKQAVTIAKEIDALNIYPAPLYEAPQQAAAEDLDSYLLLSYKKGHTDKYKALWDQKFK